MNKARRDGATPLFIETQNGDLAMVRCLMEEFGTDVNQATHGGATPLCIAAHSGHAWMWCEAW
jgi:ankyrin repeat protein